MSDDEILTAAQLRLERKRAAMTPEEIDRLRSALAEWASAVEVTDEERRIARARFMERVEFERKQREARGVLAQLIEEIDTKGDA